ncbi:MAG: hypothetical protein U9Q03_02665, partial [Patescibacteria group bacterium]|nr:hypothetical protein [Patescibacteria group bacterium]
ATDTGSFDVAGETTSNQLSLSRLKAGETNVDFALTFTLTGTDTGTLTVTFPAQFTVTSAADDPGSDNCLTNFSYTSTTLVATKTSCSGQITLGGATVTNPATPGAYTISWTNDNGSGEVYIVDDDQVSVSSDVDPTLSFNVGTSTSCDGTYSGNGGTLALGSLTTASVTTSDVSGVNHVCTRVTTNATNGAAITVRALYGALTSTSVPADTIDSSTATLSVGSEGFGICVGSDGGHTGLDATTPTGASPTAQSPFSSTCNTTTHNVGALTTSAQSVWTINGASQNAFARVFIKAAIASDTPAHSDYTETLTFIATATY